MKLMNFVILATISVCTAAVTLVNNTEVNDNDCRTTGCENGGFCLPSNSAGNGTFVCQCLTGWEGPTCERSMEISGKDDKCIRQLGTLLEIFIMINTVFILVSLITTITLLFNRNILSTSSPTPEQLTKVLYQRLEEVGQV